MSGRNLKLCSLKSQYSTWQFSPSPPPPKSMFILSFEELMRIWAFSWLRNTKIVCGILIQLVCAWSTLIFRCCGFFQQNLTSFVVWLKWCSVNEQPSNILHFILTVILFVKHFTKGDLSILLWGFWEVVKWKYYCWKSCWNTILLHLDSS